MTLPRRGYIGDRDPALGHTLAWSGPLVVPSPPPDGASPSSRSTRRGDSDLDNDVFIEGSFALLKDAGRHPGFYIDFCEIASDYFLD